MQQLLIKNIKELVQVELPEATFPEGPMGGHAMKELRSLKNAWLLIENGLISDYGEMAHCPPPPEQLIDATGKMVFPCWVDSHTHIVFPASRESEFVDRINGLSYTESAARGGGILNSARRLLETPEEVLFEQAYNRILELRDFGTGAVEIKSGYGLSEEGELKMLRVIQRLKEMSPMPVRATFLGAHAVPEAYKSDRSGYLDLMLEKVLPQIAESRLADYIDIFCEKGFFSPEDTARVLAAGKQFGLKGKIHTNQFNSMGGIEAAVAHDALSVDHLEVVSDEEIEVLKRSSLIATLLPSAPFFLNDPYQPARKLLDADIPIALATDYNPGSTPSGRMSFVLSLACIKMQMTPEEAINAATWNGACALELQDQLGSISRGKLANVFITRPMPSLAYLPYAFGNDLIETVLLKGEIRE
jgi:imidazolonepropionase